MSFSTCCCSVLLHNFSFEILSGHRNYSEVCVDADLYFIYWCDDGSPGFYSIEEYLLHDGKEEPNLGGDANCDGSPDVLQLLVL
ncbi:hypothetical protein DPMN_142241 [Dreissena polymorpha]|uniref:Uncharacterized protein n=1 Tax=Dreissena polymorpha TaxID=45954 RepID=A0A9D4GBA5_DREPO|nr:hypothetical protein DPMN_142241 [Dreissena polymorpha]